jgi:hypothetical protein
MMLAVNSGIFCGCARAAVSEVTKHMNKKNASGRILKIGRLF